jgi:hypothetical protein
MVEVKDYTKNVNRDEIKKFFRDLNAHSEVKAGIFISLHSGIVGIKEKIVYKMESIYGRKIPIIYVSGDNPLIINMSIDILISKLEARISIMRDQTELVQRIEALSDQLESLSIARLQIDEFRDTCSKSLDKLYPLIYEIKSLNESSSASIK